MEESILRAMGHGGSSEVLAASTVVIAQLRMFALGISFLNGLAIAA